MDGAALERESGLQAERSRAKPLIRLTKARIDADVIRRDRIGIELLNECRSIDAREKLHVADRQRIAVARREEPGHGVLIEYVVDADTHLEVRCAREPELVPQKEVRVAEHRRPAHVSAATVEHWYALHREGALLRSTAADEVVHANARAPGEVVGSLELELVGPVGLQPPVKRLACFVERHVEAVEHALDVRTRAAVLVRARQTRVVAPDAAEKITRVERPPV